MINSGVPRKFSLSVGAVYFALFTLFMYLPIALLVIFSFNDSPTLTFPLSGFTLKWYQELWKNQELVTAVTNSLLVGILSSLVATALGTMAALGVIRFEFPGKTLFLSVAAMPLVIPAVVMGVAMLIVFARVGVPLTLWTVGIGHVIINAPYAMLIVAARLAGFEEHVEEAAMDLGADYWATLWRVTLPMSAPALAAAFLSSFTTSLDEFAVTFFLVGSDTTLPVYLYSQLRFPSRLPLVVTLAAIMMVLSVFIVIVVEKLRRMAS
ncbi:MAG: ABC transporter permease [Ardenticatenaceae bacterium]|nr:ABC transporter permease [Anaerolineales bacterium]MCB8921118.1 ABC transporter permease [Ardenticatenaceae bacterium]MCB8990823.1 ABC transporter permease [Ardenticatenaceae bacterium]MCB9004483.1 ABC transporter permease [Ardenticatenaceae bacterium]